MQDSCLEFPLSSGGRPYFNDGCTYVDTCLRVVSAVLVPDTKEDSVDIYDGLDLDPSSDRGNNHTCAVLLHWSARVQIIGSEFINKHISIFSFSELSNINQVTNCFFILTQKNLPQTLFS